MEDQGDYAGSEPLDRALADRFAFVVQMPAWAEFSPAEKRAVIRSQTRTFGPQDAARLADSLALARAFLKAVEQDCADATADYVFALMPLLSQANIELSPRRANLLYQAVLAVHASASALQHGGAFADSALLALRS